MRIIFEFANNSLSKTPDIMEIIKNVSDIISLLISLCTLFGLVVGLGYVHSLRKKKQEGLFNFCSQIKVRLFRIYTTLSDNPGLINNMYRPEIRDTYEKSSPTGEKVSQFKLIVNETEEFLKSTSDQIPAYKGWNNDIGVVIECLINIEIYDICNPDGGFVPDGFCDRSEYCRRIIHAMKHIIKKIDKIQRKIEKQIN